MELLREWLKILVDVAILLFEFIGVVIVIVAGIRGVFDCFTRNPGTRLHLARGLAMGLEFKLGSEILHTVVVREFSEIFLATGIIALRAILTLLIHWEIKNENRITALDAKNKNPNE